MYRRILFCVFIYIYYLIGIKSQETSTIKLTSSTVIDESTEKEEYNRSYSYCFRFTWLGPSYDNTTDIKDIKGNCKDWIADAKLKGHPCRQPLVITHNAAPPNMTDLWEFHRDSILCRRANGQSCVKYSYYFNGKMQYVTYMCAKVLTINEGAENSGCFVQSDSGYLTEVCICTPKMKGDNGQPPCNSANGHRMSVIVVLLLFSGLIFTN